MRHQQPYIFRQCRPEKDSDRSGRAMGGSKKKPTYKAPAKPAPPEYTLSELLQRSETESQLWAEDLAIEAGLDIRKDIIKAYKGECVSQLDTCYFEGCVLIVELIKRGLVKSAQPADRAEQGESQRKVLKEIQNTANSLDAARENLDQKLEAVTQQMAALHQEIRTVREAPSAALEAQESKQEASRSVLLAGLLPEEVQGSEVLEQVREFIREEVQPAIEVEVVSVSRMGRYSEDVQGSRRIKVEFATAVQAQAVLRAAFHLKAFNISRKKEGDRPVGLDPFLTQAELAIKRKLKGVFDSERAKGTPKVFWRGCRLFANGQELKL